MEKNQKIDFKYNTRQYWDLLKPYLWIAGAVLLLILVFQASYSANSYLFKLLIDEGSEFVANNVSQSEFVSYAIILLIIFLGMNLVVSGLRWLNLHLLNVWESKMMLDLKKKLFNHLTRLSYEFHTNNKTGSIISRLLRGGNAVERITDVFIFNFIPLIFQTMVVGATIAIFDVRSAIVVVGVIVVFIIFSFYINRKQMSANLAANDAEDEEKAVVADIFTNIDNIKYFGKEERIQRKYLKYGNRTRFAMLRHWNYFRWLSAGHSAILAIGHALVMVFPVIGVIQGTVSIGTVGFVWASYSSIIGHLFGFDHGLRGFYRGMADFESLFKYYKVENEIKDAPDAKKLKVRKGKIHFDNISFRYKKKWVLRNFDLKIPENKTIALVGPSGSGKSTIVKILYRLYDLEKGNILIDGKEISKVQQESLRSELSIVPQEPVLFDDTIENNIAFSRPGATKKEVAKAMKFAQLDKVVAGFPDKEKTIVGERGVKLSGGEKQRVSIARAILADKKILVLDEATSALDSETEHEIQKDLEKLMKGRTSIVIAHRLSTIMKADMIVVLDKGKIVQKGTHEELIKKENGDGSDGLYKKLWNLQKGGYIK